MSGGHFDHGQYKLICIADEIEHSLELDEEETEYPYSEETKAAFKEAMDKLNEAFIYAQRIDWFLSGDDSEESFHKRLRNELAKLPREAY